MIRRGGSPEASVIGNTAERGHGMGPYADRADHVCNLEVVLPTGKVIRTGFGQFSGMELDMVQHDLASLHKTGVGPSLDQLFTQSNLGIITEMTVHLLPKPKYYQGFSFAVQNLETLELLIDKLRDLKLMGLRTSFRIFNDRRIISFFQQRPKETLGNEERALTDLEIATLRKKYSIKGLWGIGPWNVHGSLLSASKAMGKAERQLIKKTLSSLVSSIQFIDEKRAFFLRCIRPFLRKETQKKLDLVLNLGYDKTPLRGAPMSSALSMCYWQKKDRVPSSPDPDRDSCGVLWFCPVAPFHGASMRALIETSQSIVRGYGFDFNFGFLGNTERCFDVTGAICYDRELENSDERAMACHDELMDVLFEKGYFPYRLGIQSMSLLKKQDPDYADFMTQLKSTIDPNAILAPGRYER